MLKRPSSNSNIQMYPDLICSEIRNSKSAILSVAHAARIHADYRLSLLLPSLKLICEIKDGKPSATDYFFLGRDRQECQHGNLSIFVRDPDGNVIELRGRGEEKLSAQEYRPQ